MAVSEDQELVVLLKSGNAEALEQLIMRWRPRAEAYACSILHDPQAAEDAVMEAFARIYAVRSNLDPGCSFPAYLFTVVKRICIDQIRKQRRFPDLPGELPDPPVASAEDQYLRHWERLNMIHVLGELDETDRKLLLAFSLEGKSSRQIAKELSLSDVQVRVRLHRIRKRLKKGMNGNA